jgi:serine protease DegQ
MSARRGLPLAALWVIACASLAPRADAQLAGFDPATKPSLAPLARRITPAVVNIAVTGTAPRNPLLDDPLFRRFFGIPEGEEPPPSERQAAGSGVIVDAERGYVLTNHHVVADADTITVNLVDRRDLTAKLIGSDEGTDIALLQVEAEGLIALEFGDSDELEVGDFVLAVGNPFGLGQTVTTGIVSALGRTGLGIEGYEDFIQTDAAINPGNSGGALVDLDGKLVGINSAIISAAGGNVGIGFAVPSNMAKTVMEQLRDYGEIRRGRLGVMAQDLTPDLVAALDLTVSRGAMVSDVEPKSAAERAGIAVGDVITAIDGEPIESATALRNRVGLTRAGETIRITLLRDGRSRDVEAQIGEPAAATAQPAPGAEVGKLEGAEFRDLDAEHPQYGRLRGVVVTRVAPGSAAARAGLERDDVIVAVNRQAVGSVAELMRELDAVSVPFALQVARGNARLFIAVR